MPRGDFQATGLNIDAGKIVRRLRTELGLKQDEFADYVHVQLGVERPTQPAISGWENGTATVPAALLLHAIERFGVTVILGVVEERQLRVNKSYVRVAA